MIATKVDPIPGTTDFSGDRVRRSVEETASALGEDAGAYARIFRPLVKDWPQLEASVLAPLVRVPRHPVAMTRFGLDALWPASRFARRRFESEQARALFAGLAAHSILSLDKLASASFGLVLGVTGHAVGWPLPRGGSQAIANALASHLRSLGGEIATGSPVESLGSKMLHRQAPTKSEASSRAMIVVAMSCGKV